jgi:hypothetical protein
MHLSAGPAWLVWLESTPLAEAMRQWLWLYPTVEIIHILGLVVLVGGAALFDLKLLGFSPSLPLQGLACDILPWARGACWPLFLRLTDVDCSRHRDGKQPGVPSQTVVAGGSGPQCTGVSQKTISDPRRV